MNHFSKNSFAAGSESAALISLILKKISDTRQADRHKAQSVSQFFISDSMPYILCMQVYHY